MTHFSVAAWITGCFHLRFLQLVVGDTYFCQFSSLGSNRTGGTHIDGLLPENNFSGGCLDCPVAVCGHQSKVIDVMIATRRVVLNYLARLRC
jgi:hypothetical protein